MPVYLIRYPESVLEDFNEYNVPLRLRRIAITICERFTLGGLCDPMYICNVIAEMSGHGDGNGNFDQRYYDIDKCDVIAARLQHSYGCNIFPDDIQELAEIIRSEGGWDIPVAVNGLVKYIQKVEAENKTADEWRRDYNLEQINQARRVLEDLNTKYKILGAALTAPAGYQWESNGKSIFGGEYRDRLVKIYD